MSSSNNLLRLLDRFGWGSRPGHTVSGTAIPSSQKPDPDADLDDVDKDGGLSRIKRTDRPRAYQIYDMMAQFDLVASVLEAYAEDATQLDQTTGRTMWIETSDKALQQKLTVALDNLKLEERLPSIAYNLAKRGDHFRRLAYKSGEGVLGWRVQPAANVSRMEDKYDRLVGFKQTHMKFRTGNSSEISWPWDYMHFRLLGRSEDSLYGSSMLDPMFRPWRQMVLTEDAALQYRLQRSPDRYAVWVDVGQQPPERQASVLNRWRARFSRREYVDPASGQYQQKWNPLAPLENLFLPLAQDQTTRIDTLPGGGDMGQMFDLDYYLNKFFGASRAPKAYFGFEGDINAKATLSQQDVRFARGVKRLQRSLMTTVRTALDVHLALVDGPDKRSDDWLVKMTPPSYLDELDRLDLLRSRTEIADILLRQGDQMRVDPKVWSLYVMVHYLRIPADVVYRATRKFVPAGTPDDGVETGAAPAESLMSSGDLEMLDRMWQGGVGKEVLQEIAKIEHGWSTEGLRQAQTDQSMQEVRKHVSGSDIIQEDKAIAEAWKAVEAGRGKAGT